ncbi:glycosyltransferase [Geobacter pelophilus]|uniref:Glycosyltransferase n=1 Tax=Geoanaerobacter pelophilus TaxID=60036 RepID=A0AAW4L5Q7_9BACT|nr:glycosyltransferase [Geoanaerobacter pelophilus]
MYQSSRVAHWDRLADRFSHCGLRSEYHRRLTELYREIIPADQAVLEIGCAKGELLASLSPARGVGVDFSEGMLRHARQLHPSLEFYLKDAQNLEGISGSFDYIICSDLVDDLWDVQEFLLAVHRLCTPETRIVFNFYSHLWNLPLRFAQQLGFAREMLPQNWLTVEDLIGLLNLSGFGTVSHRSEILLPLAVPGVTSLCNRGLAKFKPFSWFNLTHFIVARALPVRFDSTARPTVSVIVPTRNEAGNIVEVIERIPQLGAGTEIIFVEGGSSDGTYEVIEAEIASHSELKCRLMRQSGCGKGDAVRTGFEAAVGDILMILDADMTVAPESLEKFYMALVQGHGEFINGVRLVYPLNDRAMRFVNLIGNKFFSIAFTWLLGQTIKDTLCGTKALWKHSYEKLAANRSHFGDIDPFGDFDLLLGAARLNLKIVDLPVRYGERLYGETNISRWSHGLLLFRMLLAAARKLKFV